MRVVVVGSQGQLGKALLATVPSDVEVVSLSHEDLDITRRDAVLECSELLLADAVINAAAYTDVDGAESHTDLAYAVNALGPKHLAERCVAEGSHLIHISTDYVFGDVQACTTPWDVDSPTDPGTVYGKTKLAGEEFVRKSDCASTIVRTAWIYSGNCLPDKDFVSTMIALAATNPQVTVVDDQWGNPTFVFDLARGIWNVATQHVLGTLHCVNSGKPVTWRDLAEEVFEQIGEDKDRVVPVSSTEFPRPAQRPEWSALSSRSWLEANLQPLPEWRTGVKRAVSATLLQL